jgi:hypothetical protein
MMQAGSGKLARPEQRSFMRPSPKVPPVRRFEVREIFLSCAAGAARHGS